jgi:hypothetical protein
MSYPNEEFNMEEHKAYMERAAKKRKRDWEYKALHAADENEEIRHTYLRRAKAAVALHKHMKDAPPIRLRTRVRYWFGQLIPRRHWGIYTAGGRRRICVWKTWLGRATVEIDVKMG